LPTESPIEEAFTSPPMHMSAGEPLGSALQRMAVEQLLVVRSGFDLPPDDETLDLLVHRARKAGKRVRALHRLVRADLGKAAFHNENAVVRDQGRMLSRMRIARVLVTTFDGFTPADLRDVPMSGFRQVRNTLADNHHSTANALRADIDGRAAARMALDLAGRRIEAWHPPASYDSGPVALTPGIRKVYRRGRRAMSEAATAPTAQAFHDWRKRVNYLRFQMEALSGASAPAIRILAESLHTLSEILGEEHDLTDLVRFLQKRGTDLEAEHVAAVRGTADERRSKLQETALEAARDLFAAEPDQFVADVSDKLRSSE